MKNLTVIVALVLGVMIAPLSIAETSISDKYHEPDLRLSTYKINDDYYASLSGTINIDENISISTTFETNGYLKLGTAYGDVLFDTIYVETYVTYGRSDITDIYTLGMFAGLPLNEKLMVFANSAFDWRRTQDNIGGATNRGWFDEDEWKNTLGSSYAIHRWVTLSSTYNVDLLLKTPNAVDSRVATSWDVTAAFNVPWFSPYVKYSEGNYRVTPDQERKSQNNVELGVNFNF